MRIPFLNKKVTVEVTEAPKTTDYGLVDGTPITMSTFEKVKEKFDKFYIDRVEQNKQILDAKLKEANVWLEFVKNQCSDIPKENLQSISVYPGTDLDLESIINPKVYLDIEFINQKGTILHKVHEIFSKEHDTTERVILRILEDIKAFKKEIAPKDKVA